jgi:hypothetical protein
LTQTAAVLGTLPYMSPEQRRGTVVDRRSDLFSAGVMLYEAATGVLPQGAFAPPSRMNAVYGRAFDRIVMQLLQADPARRPSSAADVARAIAAALSTRRRRPLTLLATAAALLLMVAGGRVGLRAFFRGDGKGAKEALAKIETTGPQNAPPRVEGPGTTATGTPALETKDAVANDGLTKLFGPDDAKKARPRGKITRKVVLNAISDVKALRAATKAPPRSKPVPATSVSKVGGKKKSKAALADDAFTPELEEAVRPVARVGAQPRRSDADAGPPPPAFPPRK